MGTAPRRFRFGRCLGRGSFGEVYAATMRSPGGLESPVAVKLLRADIDIEGDAVRRLRDEGRLLARLNHPAILKVFDLVTLRGRLALITELVDGADLADCIEEVEEGDDESMPLRPLVQALSQVASALDAAATTHGADGPLNLVHRDVKPSNIRIDRHGQAKLLDFGIARFDASDREVRTASDLVVGSVPYMAPERFVERGVASSSDVFSLGCTLFEGIAGKRFYGSSNVARISTLALQPEVYKRTVADRIGALPVPESLKALLHELVDIEPRNRPIAAEVSARLEELADELQGPTLRMWCRRRTWPVSSGQSGPLEGASIAEGDLDVPEEAARVPRGSEMPALVDPAMATIDPPPDGTEFIRNPVGQPKVNLAPKATIEPGTSRDDLLNESSELPDRTSQTLTPLDDALAKPPVVQSKDSVWERPYTAEGDRPPPQPIPERPPVDPNAKTYIRPSSEDSSPESEAAPDAKAAAVPASKPREERELELPRGVRPAFVEPESSGSGGSGGSRAISSSADDSLASRGCGPALTVAIVLFGLILAGVAIAIIAVPGLWIIVTSP